MSPFQLPGIPNTPMVSGFHPHHSSIMLHCVSGEVVNRRAVVLFGRGHAEDSHTRRLRRLRFDKAVEDKRVENGFTEVSHDFVRVTRDEVLKREDSVEMDAASLHTIFIQKGESAAWFVYNGIEDPNYVPYLWTSAPLDRQDASGLYQPMTKESLLSLLGVANLL